MFTAARQGCRCTSAPGWTRPRCTAIERGSILYDFFYPGDPETPGWASVPGARRLPRSEAATLPRIISVPISAVDARDDPVDSRAVRPLPEWWGHGTVRSHVGPGSAPLRVNVRNRRRAPARLDGDRNACADSEEPDSIVLVGNHRDAWVFGGVDPSTGTASMLELVRVLGTIRREGWNPKRSLLFASWDAEEFGLTSSTEWAEEHAEWLQRPCGRVPERRQRRFRLALRCRCIAVADAGARRRCRRGSRSIDQRFGASRGTRPGTRSDRGDRQPERDGDVIADRLGGGSDYTVFLNHLGVPSADLAFDGADPMYHTALRHARVRGTGGRSRIHLHDDAGAADGGRRSAPVRLQSGADRSGCDRVERPFERTGVRSRSECRARAAKRVSVAIEAALDEFADAAHAFGREPRLGRCEPAISIKYPELNRRLLQLERSFVDDGGLPGREWYRHVLMAPARSYQPVGSAGAVGGAGFG